MKDQWELRQAKGICFLADSQVEALEKALDWLRPIEDCVSLHVLKSTVSDDNKEVIAVFYEEI